MKDPFIPYELAVIAKEKGFNEPCINYYSKINKQLSYLINGVVMLKVDDYNLNNHTSAPLYQQIVDWLREKHKILITIELLRFAYDAEKDNIHEPDNIFKYKIVKLDTWFSSYIENTHQDKDYYKALNKAIKQALDLI
jgi:hypothetical protein